MRKNGKLVFRLLVAAAVLAVLLVGLWFVRRPVVAAVKEWRATSLISKAEKAMEKKNGRDAVQFASAAWQLGPKKIETIRRLMMHGRAVGLPDLSSITLVAFFHDDHETSDRVEILRWALDRGDATFFDQLYPNLEESARADPAIRILHARKLGLQGRLLEAIEEARALEGNAESEAEVSLLLATLLARLQGNPVAAQQAADRIGELLDHEDDKIALGAWRVLAILPPKFRDPGPSFDPEKWVARRAAATAGDRVLARRIVVERLPVADQAAAMGTLNGDLLASPESVSWVVRWYLETGHGESLLQLPESAFLGNVAVFSSRLQVLLESGKYEEAKVWLEKAPEDFPESVAGSLLAVFARREGRDSEALSAWRRVIEKASSLQIYGDCLSVLRIAEKFGEKKAVDDIVEVIYSLPPNRLPPSEHLEYLESYFVEKLADWLQFWRGIVRERPGDGFAVEQVAFLELLKPGEVDAGAVLERTRKLIDRYPRVPRFRATHALWLMSEARDKEALEVLGEADINWNETDPAARAVYVIALHRNGAVEKAAALESAIRWDGVGAVRRTILLSFLGSWKEPAKS